MLKVGLLGAGAIGSRVIAEISGWDHIDTIVACDILAEARDRAAALSDKVSVCQDPSDFPTDCSLIVEAASIATAKQWVPHHLERGIPVLMMSLGALADAEVLDRIIRAGPDKGILYIPSGAIGGTDALRAASMAGLRKVVLQTTKPPHGLTGNPYLEERGIDVESIRTPTLIYKGTARDAILRFPKNVNVAAAVAVSGIGFERTHVRIYCDPHTNSNSHILTAEGDFGTFRSETRNVPAPDNPKTSYLAALSAISAVNRVLGGEWLGV